MYGFPLWTNVQVSLKGGGGTVRATEPHPSCTKMSLTLVFAPVEVLQEMAAALPASPQPPLSYKISQQTDFKVCLWLFFRQSAAMPERPTNEGRWTRIHGARGCERGAGNQEDVFWRWTTLNQRPAAAQVVGVEAPASFWTHSEETWPRLRAAWVNGCLRQKLVPEHTIGATESGRKEGFNADYTQ